MAGAAALTVVTLVEGKKREKRVDEAQEQRANVEGATRAEEARVSRRQQVREARVRAGEVENVSAVTQQTGSSAAIAGIDDIGSNLATNLGKINTAVTASELKSSAEQDIFDANRKSTLEILGSTALNFASK